MALSEQKRIRHKLYMRGYRKRYPKRIKVANTKYERSNSRKVSRLAYFAKHGNEPWRFGYKRLEVLQRDNYTCCVCGMTDAEHRQRFRRAITIDHKDGQGRYSKVKNHNLDNLWTLCLPCHGRKDIQRRYSR